MRTCLVGLILCVGVMPSLAVPPEMDVPRVGKVTPLPEWEAKFAGKEGWIGGDGVYSAVLGPKRVLWLFGDTLLGTVKEGKRTGAVMVNNTLALQDGPGKEAAINFVAGKGKDDKATAFFKPTEGEGWFWPLGAARDGERLFVFLARIVKGNESGPFGFKHSGQDLAVVTNPDEEPPAWRVKQHKIPFAEFGADGARSWGSAVLIEGQYAYIYGYEERGKGFNRRRLIVARAPAGKLDDFPSWRFRTADGWSEKAADAVPLADALGTEFSVSKVPGGKGYVLVTTENALGPKIMGRFAPSPEGPWSPAVLLYTCPEMAADKGVFCYAAKAHPWAATGNELVVSYCVNAWEFGRLFRDETVYRPKFVRIELETGK
jgi:hypothetical protein